MQHDGLLFFVACCWARMSSWPVACWCVVSRAKLLYLLTYLKILMLILINISNHNKFNLLISQSSIWFKIKFRPLYIDKIQNAHVLSSYIRIHVFHTLNCFNKHSLMYMIPIYYMLYWFLILPCYKYTHSSSTVYIIRSLVYVAAVCAW